MADEEDAAQAVREAAQQAAAEQAARIKAEASAQAAQDQLAEMQATLRANELQTQAQRLGYGDGLLKHFPADAPATAEALKAFADELGVQPAANPAASAWDRYKPGEGTSAGLDTEPDINVRARKLKVEQDAVMKRLADNPFMVTEEEKLEYARMNDELNALNEEWERLVVSGEASPGLINSGMGGRMTPPAWAARFRDPRAGRE